MLWFFSKLLRMEYLDSMVEEFLQMYNTDCIQTMTQASFDRFVSSYCHCSAAKHSNWSLVMSLLGAVAKQLNWSPVVLLLGAVAKQPHLIKFSVPSGSFKRPMAPLLSMVGFFLQCPVSIRHFPFQQHPLMSSSRPLALPSSLFSLPSMIVLRLSVFNQTISLLLLPSEIFPLPPFVVPLFVLCSVQLTFYKQC